MCDGFHGDEQSVWVAWQSLESIAFIEPRGCLVLGVDEDSHRGNAVARIQATLQGVHEKSLSKSLAAIAGVDSQAANKRRWDEGVTVSPWWACFLR